MTRFSSGRWRRLPVLLRSCLPVFLCSCLPEQYCAVRVAWFSPLPPVRSGISAYSLDVLEGLRHAHAIDLYVDDGVWRGAGGHLHAGRGGETVALDGPFGLPLYRAYDFAIAHERAPYDLIVYQMGNAACHRYMWPYLLRWPGLVVLHDAALHHARAQALLLDTRADDYRAEFRFNHPGVDPRVADFVVAGLEGSPYYLWPMLRLVMSRARALVVHGAPLAEALTEEYPDTPIATVAMGVPDPRPATGNGQPATGTSRPATGNRQSATGGAWSVPDIPDRLPVADCRLPVSFRRCYTSVFPRVGWHARPAAVGPFGGP